MHYDIASKVILSHCKEPFLKFLCNLKIKEAHLMEAKPQETPSLRRSDFVLKAVLEDNSESLILVEFVSFWKDYIPLRTLETRCRHILQEKLPVKSFIVLLTPSSKAVNSYHDEEVEYRYTLIKLYEIEAKRILKIDAPCLYSFLPLMKGGKKLLEEGEKRIYEAGISRREKADLLTGMAIFAGLISEELTLQLIKRRRDIMIESAAYEIIKKEGYEEGFKVGIQQGIQQGLLEDAKEMVIEALTERFGLVPPVLVAKIKSISEREVLRNLLRLAIKVSSLEEFKKALKKLEEETLE